MPLALSPAQLKQIRKIEIASRRAVHNKLGGAHQSIFKGQGMVFLELREYVAGDDIRSIDWNVSARLNTMHSKLFAKERDRTALLIVDISASQLLGTSFGSGLASKRTKRSVLVEMAAAIAYAAISHGDRVGLILFGGDVQLSLPAKKGRKHVLRLLREIAGCKPTSTTNLAAPMDYLRRRVKMRSVSFVLSDFIDPNGGKVSAGEPVPWVKSMRLASSRHELIPVVVSDPMESCLPPLGLALFEDLETGEVVEFDCAGPEAVLYREQTQIAKETLGGAFRELGLTPMMVSTSGSSGDHVDVLLEYTKRQAHGRARNRSE